jgi:hypothetical protein
MFPGRPPDLKPRSCIVTLLSQNVYKSQNGDTWRLIRDTKSGEASVRHEANASSGGHVTEMSAEEFLSRAGSGPEYAAVRRSMAAWAEEVAASPTGDGPARGNAP